MTKPLSRIMVLMLIVASAAAAAKTPASPAVRFAVIGDRTGSARPGVYEEVVSEIAELHPDFCIIAGDQIQGYTGGDTSRLNAMWQEYRKVVEPLRMPLYLTPGNHDITEDAAQPWFEQHVGKRYYSFDVGKLHFVVLDASRVEKSEDLPQDQLEWLVKDLKTPRHAEHTFVFFHKPFWYNSLAEGRPDTLHSIFRNYHVDQVFNGHFHYYISADFDNVTYTAVGSSGGAADSGPTGIQYHYTWVTVQGPVVDIAPVRVNSVFPWNEVTVQDAKSIDRISAQGISFTRRLPLNDQLHLEDSLAELKLKDLVPGTGINDTLRWTVPEAWAITPSTLPVQLAPGDSAMFTFKARCKGQPYPLPKLSAHLPYAAGKKTAFSRELDLVRTTYCWPVPVPDTKPELPLIPELSQPIWRSPVTSLFAWDGSSAIIESTAFYFAYDADNLYLGAVCQESKMESLLAKADKQDGAVYGEDCVGYFIQFAPDQPAYQIYFNPLGTAFDQKLTASASGSIDADPKWNGTYDVKTRTGDKYWSIEVRVPLGQFGMAAKSGRQFGVNFRRKQHRLADSADWQIPLNYDARGFGRLILK